MNSVQRADLTGFGNLSGIFNAGYIEAKDVGKSRDEAERAEALTRYGRALPNLVLTDYLEFRWYADGGLRTAARLARIGARGKLTAEKGGAEAVGKLLGDFLAHQPASIASPPDGGDRCGDPGVADHMTANFWIRRGSCIMWRTELSPRIIVM